MPEDISEKIKVPESDLTKIPFADFIYQVFPQVRNHPEVTSYISALVLGLKPLCVEEKNGIFTYVKKGAMRRFSLDNGWIQDTFISIFEAMDPDLVGDSPEIKEIIAENFTRPMDLDLRIMRTQPANRTEVYSAISESLIKLGFREINLNGNTVMANAQYRVEIKTIPLGLDSSRTKWALNIYPLNETRAIFKIDLIDLPQTNEEKNQDVTDTYYASDMDQILGYISGQSGKLDLYYHTIDGQPDILHQIFGHYLDASSEVFTFTPDFNKYLFQGVREIGQRAMFIQPLFTKYLKWSLKDLIEFKKKFWGTIFPLKNVVPKWIEWEKEFIETNHKYLMSCLIGMTSGNIAVGLPLFWLDTYAYLTPFGRMIETYEEFEQFMNIILNKFNLSVESLLELINTRAS